MFFIEIKSKNKWNIQRNDGTVNCVILEKWRHNPMTFLFSKCIHGMVNKGVYYYDARGNNEKPNKREAVFFFLKKVNPKEQNGNNKPKFR